MAKKSKGKGKKSGKKGGKKGKSKEVEAVIETADDSEEAQNLRKVLRIMKKDMVQEKCTLNDFQQQQVWLYSNTHI